MAQHEGNIRDYRDLRAWQQARALVKSVYAVTRRFPKEELFGLAQQMRKAAVSVPSNVAEGYGRGSRKDYVRFLQIARGSLYEVQTQLLLAQDLGYLTVEQAAPVEHEVIQCCQLFHGLLRSLGEK